MKCNWAANRDECSIWCATLQHFNTNRQSTNYIYIHFGTQAHMVENYKSTSFFAHRLHHRSMELVLISMNFIAFTKTEWISRMPERFKIRIHNRIDCAVQTTNVEMIFIMIAQWINSMWWIWFLFFFSFWLYSGTLVSVFQPANINSSLIYIAFYNFTNGFISMLRFCVRFKMKLSQLL